MNNYTEHDVEEYNDNDDRFNCGGGGTDDWGLGDGDPTVLSNVENPTGVGSKIMAIIQKIWTFLKDLAIWVYKNISGGIAKLRS